MCIGRFRKHTYMSFERNSNKFRINFEQISNGFSKCHSGEHIAFLSNENIQAEIEFVFII